MPKKLLFAIAVLFALFAGHAGAELLGPGNQKPPMGFSVAVLEPLGGRILVPMGWELRERHSQETALGWQVIRKRDGVETAPAFHVRVEPFIFRSSGVRASTAAIDGLAQRKLSADRIISECPGRPVGLFQRICLEMTERSPSGKSSRFLYSVFYSDSLDMMAMTVAVAHEDQWESALPLFNQMGNVELLRGDR